MRGRGAVVQWERPRSTSRTLSRRDTPGFMVGPEAEATGLVRHCARLFVNGANLSVPFATIVLRKGYGPRPRPWRGAASCHRWSSCRGPPASSAGWAWGVRCALGSRKERKAIEDPEEQDALFRQMVDGMYLHSKAINMASLFEIDDVIDPVDSRHWISSALLTTTPAPAAPKTKRQNVDM